MTNAENRKMKLTKPTGTVCRRSLFLAITCSTFTATTMAAGGLLDLDGPDCSPPDCPAWAKEKLPDWVKPYVGINGVPEKWRPAKKVFGSAVKGLDRYQANQFIYYSDRTAEYLYGDYTPRKIDYRPGTLRTYEKIAAQYTAGCKTDTEKAAAMLRAMPAFFRHPVMPPCGPSVGPQRNLDDEALLTSGCGWCNEQARVFIRLCQVSGIPARMVHLFNQGHTVAEFYADGRWALADASNFFVVPGKDGKLLSVAACHDRGPGQRLYAEAKQRRLQELMSLSDADLNLGSPAAVRTWRQQNSNPIADELSAREVGFGVINYPLPR